MEKEAKIYVAGHTGLVGRTITAQLRKKGYKNLVLKTHKELDLTRQKEVQLFFETEKPEYVFVAAGLVGGIKANREFPADFYYVNMQIANNILWSSHNAHVKKLLYLGSACMYPKDCVQPMSEKMLLSGIPEYTNEGYALAKIAGVRLCSYIRRQYGDDFISSIPANAYGIGDCFDSEKSHVIPALISKYYEAKISGHNKVVMWGTGKAKREFINTIDIADSSIFLMENYSDEEPINVGTGEEVSMLELAQLIRKIVGFQGEIVCDMTKPDGMLRRIVDASRIHKLGWTPQITLEQGLRDLYNDFIENRGRVYGEK